LPPATGDKNVNLEAKLNLASIEDFKEFLATRSGLGVT
jgi:hypothetical protein